MTISRAQLMKELLPGLNALFGLEYKQYAEEHKEIFDTESSERSFEEEVKLDMRYIEDWSFALDFWILWRTLFVVLFGKGAD